MQADFFDDQPYDNETTTSKVQEVYSTNNYDMDQDQPSDYQQKSNDFQYGETPQVQNSNGFHSPKKVLTDIFVSPEQLQRREKLTQMEEDRLKQVRAKDDAERKEKLEKQQKAQQYLKEWKQQLQNETQNRQKQNRQNQELQKEARKNQNEYKNSWDKVGSNIALKDGEIPGTKDVSKMRQAILNKKLDLQ